MQIAESIPAEMQRLLEVARTALVEFGSSLQSLVEAEPAARLVGALTEEPTLAVGVLLLESGNRQLPAQPPPGLDPASFEAARELARLGEFGSPLGWADGARLDGPQAEVLRKMLLALVADPRLVVARLGIQLARLRAAKSLPEAQQRRLAAEARAVFAPLANRLGVWQVKWELEDLAFRYLEPLDYKSIATALAERRTDREQYIAALCGRIDDLLRSAGIAAEVYGRPKHIYSIHRKMQQKHLSFTQLYDVRAVRIICDSIADCYAALGVVHGHWTNLPDEFDDYIATPKPNLYRSIHTAVVGPGEKPVEIQIRTREMHEHSELGVAAHWRYKEGGGRDAGYERKIERLRQLLGPGTADADGTSRDATDFIDRVRAELFEDRVYALTPRGEVVDLPKGATPLDFAYQVHTGLGHRCRGAKVNGRIAPLTQPLANGEVVEIIAGKQESPSRDWLILDGFLASPRSRAKLRSWFRRIDATENEAAGRQILERELARLGVSLEQTPALARELKAGDTTQLYRWLGEGELSVTQLQQAVARLGATTSSSSIADTTESTPRRTRALGRAPAYSTSSTAARRLSIEGVRDLPMNLAKCCAPLAPEAVSGYVTPGRGVTVHAARCGNLRRMRSEHPERCLQADWMD
ncbi:MAG: TGS domain-containing protein [Gammaproteobacteria bacterium]|nr:TGS domain-containing protein [Gammaproteobacteria bacterium]